LIAVGTIIVMVLAVAGWFQLRERIVDQGVQAADTCVEGDAVVAVVVEPDLSGPVSALAQRFTDGRPVVRDQCISVRVTSADSDTVAAAISAGASVWDEAALGPVPALWIPRSSDSVAAVPVESIDGTPRSVATSPVVLAGPAPVTDALARADIGWADLPDLQSAPDALDVLGLGGWGGLRLQLPVGPASDSTTSALAAVVASSLGEPDRPVAVEGIRSGLAVSALSALATTDLGIEAVTPESTDEALGRLTADMSATAQAHAVPVTAQQLSNAGASDLTAYAPAGPTPMADHPAAVLAGQWTDETRRRAAAQFVDFMRQTENTPVFVDLGFEVGAPPGNAPVASPDARRAMVDLVQNPATPRRVTIVLDISGSMDTAEGERTRLQNTTDALVQQFGSVVDSSQLGLWVYSSDLDAGRAFRTVVPAGPVDETLPTGTRREQLIAAASTLQPEAATSTYESMLAAYASAVDGFVAGRPNSVLLVTDGPDDDALATSDRFIEALTASTDQNRPVSIDVVSIGENPDIETLQSMADITGGSLTTVGSSAGPELPDLLRRLLY